MKKLLLLLLLLPVLTFSQTQIGQDIDGEAADDQSGGSSFSKPIGNVSLSSDGNIVAIGAHLNDGNGINSGHVRVYENIGGVWTQIGQDIDGEASGDLSSVSISISLDGSIVAIGAPDNDGINGNGSGHVRIYENIGGVWTQIGQDIDGEAANDYSGHSVSLSSNGNIVAIGAPFNDFSGHVRIYENIGGVWTQIGQDIDGEAGNDESGFSVSLSSNGNIVAIGDITDDGTNVSDSGHVRVYENIGGTWTQIGQDLEGDGTADESGHSVSLSSDGSIVAIGARGNDGNGTNSGQVRVYKNIGGVWTQIGQDIYGVSAGHSCGGSVSLSSNGDIITIASPNAPSDNGSSSGYVRVYKNIEDVWIQIGQNIDGEAFNDVSGHSVSLSSNGNIVAIGAPFNDGNGNASGHVRIYSITSELAQLEVVDDIMGNSNGINVTANQLNSINGVSGAIDGVNYTTALDNGTFVDENNPTAAEIQAIIDQVNDTLSNEAFSKESFKLYPNPAKTQFTIQLDTSIQLEKVIIYNLLSQVVLTSEEKIINTTKLSSGSYIVEITTNKGKASKKLIIE